MSTSKHAFDQVKSILGKLDRSIDDARARRLETRPGAGVNASPAGAAPAPAPHPLRQEGVPPSPLNRAQPRTA